jgi:membrane peptidoglycan carboxypeptidase
LIPALDVLEQMGAQNALQTAGSFGLDLEAGPGFVSDSPPQPLLDVAAAYGVFAAQGVRNGQFFGEAIEPSAVLRVETLDGVRWLDWSQPESQAVVEPQLAYLMNHILSDGPARWPGWGNPNVLEIGRPAAMKSGWTGGADAWMVGYSPARVVAAWTGLPPSVPPFSQENGGMTGGLSPRLPAALWSALMQAASASLPADGWTQPAGVTEMDVCDPSGLLPTRDCPDIVREVFLTGSEPTPSDNLFRAYAVNRETGLLATVFTPPDLVEERVFMVVPAPAGARDWAAAAGIPVPPEAYDAIQVGAPNPNVNITEPSLFAEISGRVEITGTAAGEGFQYYRIQVGQGLNPREWIQIGGDVTAPVTNDLLAEWDTTGLSGLYAIQLVVVYEDQRVETAVGVVMVK